LVPPPSTSWLSLGLLEAEQANNANEGTSHRKLRAWLMIGAA
jgi:hypothetical protein